MFKRAKSDTNLSKRPLQVDRFGNTSDHSLRVSVVAVLLAMAYVDNDLFEEEYNAIIRAAVHEFQLMDHEAMELWEVADFMIRDKRRINNFLNDINERYSQGQKERIYELAQKVATADGRFGAKEEKFSGFLKNNLGIGNA